MATSFKTPGVYVEEISTFPPSVAQVETAIPAFIGYTEKAFIDGINYHDGTGIIKPIKISWYTCNSKFDFFTTHLCPTFSMFENVKIGIK